MTNSYSLHDLLTIDQIIHTVASFYKVKPRSVTGRSRTHRFAWPRQVAVYFCRQNTELTSAHIARVFRRDHTYVQAARNSVLNSGSTDRRIRAELVELDRLLCCTK
jgi:chromosomal replication initiator protein